MVEFRAKFDSELRDIHSSYLDLQRDNRERLYPHHSAALHGGPLSLLLQFGEDLASIEARGFHTLWAEDHFARGNVHLADLEAVASHPEVIQLEHGGRFKLALNTSAIEITARAGSAGLSKAVWSVTSAGAFNGTLGQGVLIGIIDTGIDIMHDVFLAPRANSKAPKRTRIKRIWDMGLIPDDDFKSPDKTLLPTGFTYGVEYTDTDINAFLSTLNVKKKDKPKNAKVVKHKDCHGHGTHVASIAAGNGSAVRNQKAYDFVGVAPRADLIIVKMFYLEHEPTDAVGRLLTFSNLFEDACNYILAVAKKNLGDPPVVINASLGQEIGPHDGLTALDQHLETLFKNATKQALVVAAGNESGSRQHAEISMSDQGALTIRSVDVVFSVYDERTVLTDNSRCRAEANAAPDLVIEFWYPKLNSPGLSAVLIPPSTQGPNLTTAPVLGAPAVQGTYGGISRFPFEITHEADTTQRPPATTTLQRNVLRIKFKPVFGKYNPADFTLRLTAPVGAALHAWAQQEFMHGIRIGHDNPDDDGDDVVVVDDSTLDSPGTSAGAITVAAYVDHDDKHPQKNGNLADFSSRGPLVDYSKSGPYTPKPDLAAPGFQIEAAMSGDVALRKLLKAAKALDNADYAPYARLDGTSMAAPHVAGVAALMFEKNKSLTRDALIKRLKAKARDPKNQKDTFGDGKVNAKDSVG